MQLRLAREAVSTLARYRAPLFTRTAPCVECSFSAIGSEVSGIHVWGLFEPQDLCFFCTGFSSSIYERSRSRRSICWHVIISVNKLLAAGFPRKVSFANFC